MLVQEFYSRTGYQPTAEEWAAINETYMQCDADKDTFCQAWRKCNASKADRTLNEIKERAEENKRQQRIIDLMLKYIDKRCKLELEYDPIAFRNYFAGFNMQEVKRTICQFSDWRGFTSGFSSREWHRYWELEHVCHCF